MADVLWRLTSQERRAVEAMRAADSEADAAATLGLSPHTVHNYLRNARSKLGVRTTRQAIDKLSTARHEQA